MSPARYTLLQIMLHWAVALLILSQWLTYGAIVRTHNPLLRPSAADLFEHKLHNYGGMAIGCLIALRLLLRFAQHGRTPRRQGWIALISASVHWSLYGLVLLQAVSGFAASYLTPSAIPLHKALWSLVWPLIILHILAAAYHLIRADGVVSGMLPRPKQ